jgi:SPP1 gp7 family putative phage head morphogenesis protein
MQKQVSAIVENLHANVYQTIDQYRHDAYTTGFVGTMYDLHYQDMPLLIPINRDAVLKAVQHDTKLTSPLYDTLGIDTKKMSKSVSRELSRGLASGLTYDEIARNIRRTTKAPLSRAKTIARTEGHRIHEQSSQDAAVAAKEQGADLVKQWDATLDGDTRPNHRQLDGQIRELEEPYEVGSYRPMHPGDFGTASEDCNCRCLSLKRARWELDEDELVELKKRAESFGLDKSEQFADFEKKYLKAVEENE